MIQQIQNIIYASLGKRFRSNQHVNAIHRQVMSYPKKLTLEAGTKAAAEAARDAMIAVRNTIVESLNKLVVEALSSTHFFKTSSQSKRVDLVSITVHTTNSRYGKQYKSAVNLRHLCSRDPPHKASTSVCALRYFHSFTSDSFPFHDFLPPTKNGLKRNDKRTDTRNNSNQIEKKDFQNTNHSMDKHTQQ